MNKFETPNEIPDNLEQDPKDQERNPKDIFFESFNNRMDELVQEGIFPQQFADRRKTSAALIEEGLSDPGKQGKDFAEIGMEEILEFKERIDSIKDSVVQKVNILIDRANEIISKLKDEKSLPIPNTTQKLEHSIENIQEQLKSFEATVEEVKSLNAGLQAKINSQELESNIQELEELLDKKK